MAITTRNSSQPKKIKVATRLNPSVISSWQYKNQSALDIINSYNDRISKNEYLSADDIKAYRTAIDDYKSTGDSLIGLTFSGPGDSVEKRNWENHLIQLNRNYNSVNNHYSQFADATQYKYATIPFAEDFDENSQYKSTYVGGEKRSPWNGMYINTGYTDIDYDVINRDETAIGINRVNDLESGDALAGTDNSERYQMTDDEIKTFNYIYKTEGPDAAYAYIDYIESDLTARQRASEAAEWKAYAAEKPVAASVFSVLTSPLKAVSYVGQTADYLSDGKIDQNAGYNKFSNINTAIRNEVNDVVTKKWGGVGSFAYNTGMSMADFLFTTALGGGSSAVSLGIMGTSAAADTVISSKDRGLNDNQAFILGAVAGGAEILTEKLSIDALLDLTKLGKNAAGYVIKNILSEGGEEVTSSLVNLLADVVVAKDQSAWRQSINAYKANGDNDSQAFWHTARDTAVSLGLDFLGGAVSGGVMGGAAVGVNAIGTTIQGAKTKQEFGENAGADITRATLDLAPENAYALKMQKNIDKGKNLSAYQTGKISGEFNAELDNLIANEARTATEENIQNQRRSTTAPNTANAETYITEAPVERNTMFTEEETAKASKLIERAAQDKIGKIDGFTDETANVMVKDYDGSVSPTEYVTTFEEAFKLGRDNAQVKELTRLSEESGVIGRALLHAYDAGLQSRNVALKATNPENSVLQNGTESAIINTESEINSNEGQTTADSLYLRDGSERLGGTNPEGQIPRVEGRAGQNQEWREGRSRPADGEAARILDEGRGREVTVAQLGILHGSKNQKVRVIDNEADFTPSMKKAYADAKKQGLNVKFFVGDNLLIEEANGSISNVRGYILGNTVLVRADHQYYTSDQLVRHEAGHDMIAKGQVDVKKVRNRLKDTVGEKNYNEAARAYTEAYGRTGLDADAVWEELICDSLGDMNIFAQDEAQRELFDLFIPDVQKAVSELKTEAKTTEGVTEGKASRDLRNQKGSKYLTYKFSGVIHVDYTNVYVSDEDLAVIGHSVKTGWGRLNPEKTLGGVFTANDYYVFTYNNDHSITIINAFDLNAESETVDIVKEAINDSRIRANEIEAFSGWVDSVRDGGRFSFADYTNDGGKTREEGKTFKLDDRTSEGDSITDNRTGNKNSRTEGKASRELDLEYLSAVNRGDMETAQRMVDEAAKKAGYDTEAYHGTNQGDFTVFDWDKTQRADGGFFGRGHYFTKSESMAKLYGDRIVKGKLKLGKTFVWSEKVNSYQGKKPPELLSRNIVSRINMAKLFPDIFANQTMSYWEYDTGKGENIEKTIKWGKLESVVNSLSNGMTLKAYVDGTYRWHTEGRFWEVPVGESYPSVEKANEGKFFAAINALKEKYDGLLSNMAFDDQIAYTQQYGTEITEALKNNGYTSAMDTPEGGEIVVFDSEQVKSADPVTYDDNGNVIPLSERFNPKEKDIRYSRELDLIDYINEKANVERENMTKAQQLSKIRAELESMKVGKAELMAVQKIADALYGQYGGDASVTEFRYAMLEATKLALENDGFDAAYEVISEMAKEVAYNPKNITGAAQVLAGIKREIRGTKLAVHDTDKTSGEFDRYGGYGEFRKRLFGKINLANEGVDVDSKYIELQNLYGEEFFPEVNTVSEQLMQLEHVMNTPLTDYMTESEAEINDKADDLAQETFSHLGKVWSRAMQDMDVAKRTIKLGSPRATLANALTSVAQSPIEQKKLKEYQQNVDSLNELEKRLFDVRTKINDIKYRKSLIYDGKRLSAKEFEQMAYDIAEARGVPARNVTFTTLKGEGNTGRYNAYVYTEQVLSAEKSFRSGEEINELKKLEEEARIIETRLHDFDSKLLSLEASQPLRDIITRERTEAYNAAAEKGREALQRNVEGRNKTARKQQILSIAKDLDKLMNRGTKERNVKEGERDLVGLALDLSDMLFVSDDDLIMRGFATTLTPSEETAANHFRELYDLYHSYDNAVTENKDRRAELRAEMNDLKKQLSTVLERERIQISNTKSDAIFNALISEYEVLQNSEDDYIAHVFDTKALEHLKSLRKSVGNTTYANMSLSQLEKIYEAFTIVQTMVRNTNKIFKAKKGETAAQSGKKLLNEVKAYGHKERFTEVDKLASTYSFNNLKPIYLMERIGSEELSERFQNVIEAESVYAADMKDAKAYALEQKEKYNVRKWNLAAKKSYKTTTGQEFELDLGQRLTLYAYYKRGDQAINHLSSTGFVFDNITPIKDEKGKLSYTLNDKTAYKVSGPVFIEILNSLTKEQKAYADAMIRYLSDTMGSKGNEVSFEMYGTNLFTEENYFPIRSDKAYLERAREQANGDVKIKNKGFTKETQKGANNPIVLSDFNTIWSTHVDEMSAYHAFTLPLEDFYKVYNYQNKVTEDTAKESVIGAITNAYGSAATNAIDQLLKDINGGTRSDPRETFGKKMLTMFKKAKTMLSLSVVIQQPSSIIRAQSMIDPKYFLKKKIGNEKRAELWQEMQKYAPVTIIKDMGHFDVGLGPSSSDWLMTEEYSGFPEKAKAFIKDSAYRDDVLSRPASLADELTWCKIWNAVKLETASKNPKMNTNSEQFLQIAGKRFEDVVRRTQVYDSTLAKSGNMRSKALYMQMATAFLAEPTTSINMLEMAIRSKDKKRIGRTMAAVYGAALLNSILVALPYAMRDDDEDETFAEKYVSALTTSLIDNVNPVTSLPLFKDVWSMLQGYDVKRTDMSVADDIINSLKNIISKAQNGDPDQVVKSILGLIGDLSAFTSIPVDNVIRDVYSVINAGKTITRDIEGMDTTWNSLGDALQKELQNDTPIWGWIKSESKGDKLYDAVVAGDEKYVARFRAEYEDKYADVKNEAEREKKIQSALDSALRKALRDNDPRIREAAEAAYNNKTEEFNKLYKEIVGDGIFTEDIIYGALKAELEAIIRENEE